jgi:hypothetical protein
MTEQPAGNAGEEGGDGEADQACTRHMDARHLRRHIVVADGAKGAAEARMDEAIDDVNRQNDKSCDPPQVRQPGNAGKPERAPGIVAQIDDGDLDDDRQAQRRHREIVPAQPGQPTRIATTEAASRR